jgi:hypothetical protein
MAASTAMRNSTNSVRLRGRDALMVESRENGLAVVDEATGSNPDVKPRRACV